ncbi:MULTISPECIES: hypothetical protein [Rufibacter]|uniref:2TM domain-containing protein n=1 Tax=Rufibacter quisquiliarum TaxID=1549639 RepID=A0A839GZQ6_9BACT|nr:MULTISPECIES: hypothetical protein [Rufibacter]MBA9079161.1 hypothetical protein [Rufibacter quisquiliarum]
MPKERKAQNVYQMMKKWNNYYRIGVTGLVLNLLLVLVLPFVVDPYFAAIFNSFFPVWVILLVVGWRKEHPRR